MRVTDWLQSGYVGRVAARVARTHGLDPDDVPDLLQELRIALWKAGPETSVGPAWLFQVAANKAVNVRRARARIHRREDAFAGAALPHDQNAEIEHLLHAWAARLPARLRRFYELHYAEGLSERETADRLGVCRATVRWLDRSCRRRIGG
jgi:RNA polymerase sigma factor (sigma-70 family)